MEDNNRSKHMSDIKRMNQFMHRNSTLDVVRIISMIAIVTLHFTNSAGLLYVEGATFLNVCFLRYIFIVSFISVNVFGLLTGYLNVNKRLKWNRLIDLVASVVFWCCMVVVVMVVFFPDRMTGIQDYISALCPPLRGKYWYLVSYIFVYFMMPFLNRVVVGLGRKNLERLLWVLFLLLSVTTTIGRTDFFRLNQGRSAFWLMACYLGGAYIRLYETEFQNKRRYCCVFFILSGVLLLWWTGMEYFSEHILGEANGTSYWPAWNYSVPAVVMAVCFFLWMLNVKMTPGRIMSSALARISSLMFGVYIIHANAIFWDKILRPFIENHAVTIATANFGRCVVYTIGGIMIIVLATACLELIRQGVFKALRIDKALQALAEFLNKKVPLSLES